MKKQGHTFLNGGRYPKDPEGLGCAKRLRQRKKA